MTSERADSPLTNVGENFNKSKRGLASASEETRLRVAREGGIAPHQRRGLAAASEETRSRVARAGGDARAHDKQGLIEAGRRGGEAVKVRYGREFYREIGEKGGGAVKQRYGSKFYSQIGKRGGEAVKQERGMGYYSTLGRKGGVARTFSSPGISKAEGELDVEQKGGGPGEWVPPVNSRNRRLPPESATALELQDDVSQ